MLSQKKKQNHHKPNQKKTTFCCTKGWQGCDYLQQPDESEHRGNPKVKKREPHMAVCETTPGGL